MCCFFENIFVALDEGVFKKSRNMVTVVICCWESAHQRPSDEFEL